MSDELAKHRAIINECDREITRLLHRRARAAREIGAHKQARGEPFYDAARQKEVLRQVVEAGMAEARAAEDATGERGGFPAEGLRRVFSEIMAECLNLERPIKVGYLGPPGTYSHEACLSEFGSTPELKDFPSFSDVFDAVDRAWVDYGVVPIENSTNGMVHHVLDLFVEHELTIIGETIVPVHHCLLASDASLAAIKRVYSHPQGLQQCQQWLRRTLPGAEQIEASSTVAGVRRALEEGAGAAAIGSALAAELHGANILAPNIEDVKQNVTRFLTLARHPARRSDRAKTSLIFSVPDRPGALFQILRYFSEAGINLTKIENRPSKRKLWDYVFFVDLVGHHADPAVAGVIEQLRGECTFFKLLGSYPPDLSGTNGGGGNGGGGGLGGGAVSGEYGVAT